MFATAAEYTPDGRLYLLGGDIDTLNAASLPVVSPFLALVVKFCYDPSDPPQQRMMRLVPLDPEGQLMRPPLHMPLNPPRLGSPAPGSGVCLHMINTQFPVLGEYTFHIEVDGVELAKLPLRIRLVQPEQ